MHASSPIYCTFLLLFMALVSVCCLSFLTTCGGEFTFQGSPTFPGLSENPTEQFWVFFVQVPCGFHKFRTNFMWILLSWCLSQLGSAVPASADTEPLSGLYVSSNSLTWVWIPSPLIIWWFHFLRSSSIYLRVGFFCLLLLFSYFICNFYILKPGKDFLHPLSLHSDQKYSINDLFVFYVLKKKKKDSVNIPLELNEAELLQ